MQITGGTVAVTNNDEHIVGTDVDWQDAVAGSLFIKKDATVPYTLLTDAVKTSGVGVTPEVWEADLSVPYAQATEAALVSYVIHVDFDGNGLAIIAVGDTELRTLCNRNFAIISAGGIGGPGGGGTEEQFFSFNLTNGALTEHTCTFTIAKANANYVPRVIILPGAADSPKLLLKWIIKTQSAAAFTIALVDAPNTSNYVLKASA